MLYLNSTVHLLRSFFCNSVLMVHNAYENKFSTMTLSRAVVFLMFVCGMARLTEGWFFECDDLEPEEYEKRKNCWTTTQLPSTTSSTKKLGKTFHDKTRRLMMSLVLRMKQTRLSFQLANLSHPQQVLEGTIVALECPGADKGSKQRRNLKWFSSGVEIDDDDLLNWRVKRNNIGELELWPALPSDSGHFECYVDDVWRGQLSLTVVSVRDAIRAGFINFLYTVLFAALVFVMLIGQLLFALYHPSTPIIDPMIEFNEQQLALTDKEYSVRGRFDTSSRSRCFFHKRFFQESITGLVDDDGQQVSTRSGSAPRSIRHTIETLLLIERPPSFGQAIVVAGHRK